MLERLNLEDAQKSLLDLVTPLPVETVFLLDAYDRVISQDFHAPHNLPLFPRSAADGFAVPENGAGPGRDLIIKGWLRDGDTPDFRIGPGQTAGVVTGGPLPAVTSAVIPQEMVIVEGERAVFMEEAPTGDNIRLPGEDFRAGEVLARPGNRLGPGLLGVMAAFGRSEISVYRRPRVAIVSLGREIVPCHEAPEWGQLRDSNGPLLASLVRRDGGEVAVVRTMSDEDPDAVKTCLEKLLQQSDLVLTIGGTASGPQDQALPILRETGMRILFWGIKIKPGSHSGAAVCANKPVIALSGNPAACAVGYQLLAAPVLRILQGLDPAPRRLQAICVNSFPKKGGPRRFLQGYAFCSQDGWRVAALPRQKSSMFRSLISSNALIELPSEHPPLEPNTAVEIILLDYPGLQTP